MFDQLPEDSGDGPFERDPIWDPSGWTPVFVDGLPGEPNARLIGHTRLRMDAIIRGERVRTFMLGVPGDASSEGDFMLVGAMVIYPYRQDGILIWAWHLEVPKYREHIPDFRPLPP